MLLFITEYNKHKNYLRLIRTRKKCYKYLIEQNFYKLRWGQNDKIALFSIQKYNLNVMSRCVLFKRKSYA